MNVIYPLAVPKGRRLCCEVCEAPAERVCAACTVTYYCGAVHQKADWGSIHEKICQLLIPLRTSMPFYNSEEERQHGLQQQQQRQKHLIEFCYTVAQKYLFEGKHEDAVPAALHSLRFRMNVYGLSSVELVPAYLLLAEASLGLGQTVQAEEYLSQAQWTVLKSTHCSNATYSLLHRNLGLLYMAKKNYEEARYHLANDIYFASCAFGTEDIRTSGGYFQLANIFYGLNKLDLADTLYTKQVSEIWHKYLNDHYQVLSQARVQQIDLLGKRFENDTGLDNDMLGEAEELPGTVQLPALSLEAISPPGEELPVLCAVSLVLLQEVSRTGPDRGVLMVRAGSAAQGLFFLSSLFNADEAQEAEAIRTLTSILNIRESTLGQTPLKTIFVLKILVMLYYLMMNFSKASFPRNATCKNEGRNVSG
ncbi:Zinc finger MYND domain-containing protein 12 [Tupaia chinensis]|uniref:Zinc finger MYND domain-containing protein 12 n=1 Tax=Tupaia chinensis TaxID=246437 RepID=L8Y7Y0_TUPCH|nr:Zinc finger MYND domain-containing protein 12 [Tupaia chinensis]